MKRSVRENAFLTRVFFDVLLIVSKQEKWMQEVPQGDDVN